MNDFIYEETLAGMTNLCVQSKWLSAILTPKVLHRKLEDWRVWRYNKFSSTCICGIHNSWYRWQIRTFALMEAERQQQSFFDPHFTGMHSGTPSLGRTMERAEWPQWMTSWPLNVSGKASVLETNNKITSYISLSFLIWCKIVESQMMQVKYYIWDCSRFTFTQAEEKLY